MAKSKEGKGSEYYLGIIRKLKSENRNLKKRLKQLEKREHFYEDNEEDDDDIIELPVGEENEVYTKRCNECGKGMLKTFEIVGRVFETCETCGYRKKIKG
jgi:hypothetical protein